MQLTLDSGLEQIVKDALVGALGADFENRCLALAVSGGGDSMAMLHLVAAVMPAASLHVISVNHKLREEAGAEVELVAGQCSDLGVGFSPRGWRWDGQGNLQAAAREGRWAEIRSVVSERGLDAVLVGHTEDDQIENFFLRLARGSGVDGLSGMAAFSARDGISVVRPLLLCRRAELRDWLETRGLPWADDPSNEDRKYDRVRARAMLESLEDLGLTRKRVLQTVAHMRSASDAMQEATLRFVQSQCRTEFGDVVIDLGEDREANDEVLRRVVSRAIQWVGGGEYRPRMDALVNAIDAAVQGKRATLQGCLLSCKNNEMRVGRELSATASVTVTDAQDPMFWDQRWEIESAKAQDPLDLRALGEDGLAHCLNWRQLGIPRDTLLTTPSVWSNGTLIAAPIAGYVNGWSARIVADFEEWLVTH